MSEILSEKIRMTAAIIKFGGNREKDGLEDTQILEMKSVLEQVNFDVTETLSVPADSRELRQHLLRLTDDEQVNVIFISNRTGSSENDQLFELEERYVLEESRWMRRWSRQRILYNDYDHAITVVRGRTLIMNFEHEFCVTGKELPDILDSWRETYAAERCLT